MNRYTALAVFFILLLAGLAAAQTTVAVPNNTRINLRVEEPLWADKLQAGNEVTLALNRDLKVKDVKIPKNAKVIARVTEVWKFDNSSKTDSHLGLVATRIEWDGGTAPLNAFIVGDLEPATDLKHPDNDPDWLANNGCVVSGRIFNTTGTDMAIDSAKMGQTGHGSGPRQLPRVQLRPSDDPNVNSYLLCDRASVYLKPKTTFTVRQLSQ